MAIQLTASGPRVAKDDAWLQKKAEFARRHCVVFENFVAPSFLERVPRWLETGQYERFDHARGSATGSRELVMRSDQPLVGAFDILLNQGELFKAIAEFADIEKEVWFFLGRCYKRLPIASHFDSWHTDVTGSRVLGLSISLSPMPVQGGEFQIRSARTGKVLRRVAPRRLGDAHLFRVSSSLEHRISSVRGRVPKYAFAGWFLGGDGSSRPDREALRNAFAPASPAAA